MEYQFRHKKILLNGLRVTIIEWVFNLMNQIMLSLPLSQPITLASLPSQPLFVFLNMVMILSDGLGADLAGRCLWRLGLKLLPLTKIGGTLVKVIQEI